MLSESRSRSPPPYSEKHIDIDYCYDGSDAEGDSTKYETIPYFHNIHQNLLKQ